MKASGSILIFILLLPGGYSFTYQNEEKFSLKKLTLVFNHIIANKKLVLDALTVNPLGESLSIQKFRYYVSNFSVTNEKGEINKLPIQYFLIDEAIESSKRIVLTIPDMPISAISYLLGVDSIQNVSGIQTGSLDPLHGMYWTWNSGYIMAKLEGVSPVSTSVGHRFTYHIGGYKESMKTAKNIELKLSGKSKPIHEIQITGNIDCWFKSKTEISIASTPVCHSPGDLAVKIADNYSNLFSIKAIH